MLSFFERRLHELVYLLAFPFLVLIALAMVLVRKMGFREARQRLGLGPWPAVRHGVWVHVSSAGELAAARPFLHFWKDWSREPLVLSYFNAEVGDKWKKEGLFEDAFVLPLENPFAYRWLLSRMKPRRAFFFETELWPLLMARLERHKVPAFLLNAYINDKPFATYQKWAFLFKRALARYRFIGVRTQADGERWHELGAPAKRIGICGDLKYDAASPAMDRAKARKTFLGKLPPKTRVVVYGSTHGEEDLRLVDLVARVDKGRKGPAKAVPLVHLIAPRYADRVKPIAARCEEVGLAVHFRSKGAPKAAPKGGSLVLILDTFGELRETYAMADLVFIGGSLIDHGGHNPLEALYAGVVPRVGPHMQNFADMMQTLAPHLKSVTEAELEKEVAAVAAGKLPKYPPKLGLELKAKYGGAARKLAEAVEWAD